MASAPRNNHTTGRVFIFDIVQSGNPKNPLETKLDVHVKFSGTQMGEYFGYTLMVEDLNGDGFPDLLVSAPFYSRTGDHDNGAVYVFINDGKIRIS